MRKTALRRHNNAWAGALVGGWVAMALAAPALEALAQSQSLSADIVACEETGDTTLVHLTRQGRAAIMERPKISDPLLRRIVPVGCAAWKPGETAEVLVGPTRIVPRSEALAQVALGTFLLVLAGGGWWRTRRRTRSRFGAPRL